MPRGGNSRGSRGPTTAVTAPQTAPTHGNEAVVRLRVDHVCPRGGSGSAKRTGAVCGGGRDNPYALGDARYSPNHQTLPGAGVCRRAALAVDGSRCPVRRWPKTDDVRGQMDAPPRRKCRRRSPMTDAALPADGRVPAQSRAGSGSRTRDALG